MRLKTVLIGVVLVLVTGCGIIRVQNATPQATVPTGGLFVSTTSGESWVPRSSLYTVDGQAAQVGYNKILAVEVDPSDPNTVYVATDAGLYYTYNWGEGWFMTLNAQGVVNDVTVDQTDRCT